MPIHPSVGIPWDYHLPSKSLLTAENTVSLPNSKSSPPPNSLWEEFKYGKTMPYTGDYYLLLRRVVSSNRHGLAETRSLVRPHSQICSLQTIFLWNKWTIGTHAFLFMAQVSGGSRRLAGSTSVLRRLIRRISALSPSADEGNLNRTDPVSLNDS